ncbi:MAG TPA: hypothetical protein VFB54_04245 [Burkholderiales bacterium]|nr:hypothetical protein [Burkholderiales bacterium]
MPESIERLLALMEEVEGGDALDFADLPVSEGDARRLVAASMLQMQEDLVRGGVGQDVRELVLLATAGHLVLENFLVHYRHLKQLGQIGDVSVEDVLAKLKRPRS